VSTKNNVKVHPFIREKKLHSTLNRRESNLRTADQTEESKNFMDTWTLFCEKKIDFV